MRIGIDIRNIGKQRTGDEKVFLNLIRGLAKLDTENTYVLCVDTRSDAEIADLKKTLGIEGRENFHIASLGSGNKFLWNTWVLPRYVRKHPVDIYHTQYVVPFFLPRLVKVVTHMHDVSFKVFPQLISFLDRFFLALLIPRSLKRADFIVAVSQFTKNEIIARYNIRSEKIQVISNAASGGFEKKGDLFNDTAVKRVYDRYHLPEKYILYVGTLQPRKNIPVLLRAFEKLHYRVSDVKLVLAGNRQAHHTDPEIEHLIKTLNIEKNVLFPGYISDDDLPYVFCLASAFVYPSVYEGFGMPILEAMSQGIPVAASDIPPHREVAGEAAVYFPPSDVDFLTEILYDIFTNETFKKKYAEGGYSRSVFFSWDQSARKLLELYRRISSNSNS